VFLASSRFTGFGVLVYLPSSRLVYFFFTLGGHGFFAKVFLEVLTHAWQRELELCQLELMLLEGSTMLNWTTGEGPD